MLTWRLSATLHFSLSESNFHEMTVRAQTEYRVEPLAKGLRILSLFTGQRPAWRVSDIAPAVGMPFRPSVAW